MHGEPLVDRLPERGQLRRVHQWTVPRPGRPRAGPAAVRFQEKWRACATAPRASAASRPARSAASPMTWAQSSGAWPSTSTPETPSRTAVTSPPTAAATTGVAAGLGLQRDQPERLVVARHRDQVGGPVERGQVGAGQRRQEPHRVGQAERRGQLDQRGRPVQPGAAGPADDRPMVSRAASSGSSWRSSAAARSSTSGRLERLDPADEGDDRPVDRQAEPHAGPRPRRRARARAPAGRTGRGRPRARPRPPGPGRRRTGRSGRGPRSGCWRPAGRPPAVTCSSPTMRTSGSGRSPSASIAFLTLARVCAVCTSGTPQRSLASQPTWPDSQ